MKAPPPLNAALVQADWVHVYGVMKESLHGQTSLQHITHPVPGTRTSRGVESMYSTHLQ